MAVLGMLNGREDGGVRVCVCLYVAARGWARAGVGERARACVV